MNTTLHVNASALHYTVVMNTDPKLFIADCSEAVASGWIPCGGVSGVRNANGSMSMMQSFQRAPK